jgi:ABC-type nitrate/sulfonate/bicarbonate transport system substrate-binding protein
MKKAAVPSILSAVVLLAVAVVAEAQPLPIRVGYTALAGSFSPLWVAKELDLFERQGIRSSPIYMASTLAYQAMLAGETDFTVGASAILVLGTSPAEFLRTRNEMIGNISKI